MPGQDGQEVADPLLAGKRVGEGQVGLDRVAVAATGASARDVAGDGQLVHDPVRGTFGDSDRLTDLAKADARVLRDAEQHPGVVGEKRPAWRPSLSHVDRLAFLDSFVMYPWHLWKAGTNAPLQMRGLQDAPLQRDRAGRPGR